MVGLSEVIYLSQEKRGSGAVFLPDPAQVFLLEISLSKEAVLYPITCQWEALVVFMVLLQFDPRLPVPHFPSPAKRLSGVRCISDTRFRANPCEISQWKEAE
jgi:hypothetical protein